MSEIVTPQILHALWVCLVIAIASASVSMTITQTELFVPVRAFTEKLGHMIGYLFKCFYCMNHWVVIAGMVFYHPRVIVSDYILVDWIVSTFFTITLSSYISGFMFKVFLTAMAKKQKEQEMHQAKSQSQQ